MNYYFWESVNISNPFLKFNLKSDYEVVGQYQLSEILGEKNIFIEIEKEKIDNYNIYEIE